jgi:hypothetical protein
VVGVLQDTTLTVNQALPTTTKLGIANARSAIPIKKEPKMKWLKNLLNKLTKKNQKPKSRYPTAEEVKQMTEEYKRFLAGITRDEKGRWITADGDVANSARIEFIIEKKWEDNKNNLLKSCKCNGGAKCECKNKKI